MQKNLWEELNALLRDNTTSLTPANLTFLDVSKGMSLTTIESRSRGIHIRPLGATASSVCAGPLLEKVAWLASAAGLLEIDVLLSVLNRKYSWAFHTLFFVCLFFPHQNVRWSLLDPSPKTWKSASPHPRAWFAVLDPKRGSTALNPFWDLKGRICSTRRFPMDQESPSKTLSSCCPPKRTLRTPRTLMVSKKKCVRFHFHG